MLTPDQFNVNEAWIAVKINTTPIVLQEGISNIYGLVDAGSCYVLGFVVVLEHTAIDKNEIEALFNKSYQEKKEWASRLLITEQSSIFDVFKSTAEKNGLSVEYISLSEVEPIVGELRNDFMASMR